MSRVYLSPPDISPKDHNALDAVLSSNWVAPVGPDLAAFEKAIGERLKRDYAVALNSGTAALHLALQALEIGPGDTVICPSLTFAASANPICYCGAQPVFVDSESQTWNMDPVLLEQALIEHSSIKAVIVVHLYGQCAQMDAIVKLCDKYKVALIEDAAEALGATYQSQPAGSFGDLSFLSFNGNKIITTSGGGMLLSNNADWIERARYLATQAREPVLHYEHKEVGFNYRLSNVLAALGKSQLGDLDSRIEKRKAHFEAYRTELSDLPGVNFMPIAPTGEPNYWLTCLTSAQVDRTVILEALEAQSIEARPLWKPMHLQPVFSDCFCYGGSVAEELFQQGICLPSGSSLSSKDRGRVIAAVRACFAL